VSDYQLPAPWRCEAELRAGGVMSVTLAGEFDLAAAPEIEAAVRRAQALAARVVVDLERVEFLDSTGLHVLLAATARARESGAQLVITQPSDCVRRLLALTNTLDHLTIDDGQPARISRSSDRSS
jgi:anti-sigma B factor antagonist